MEIITETGFKCTVPDTIVDDMEFVDDLIAMTKGNMTVVPDVIARLIGDKKPLYDHCRKNGVVSAKAVVEEIGRIFNAVKQEPASETKNS